MCVECGVDAGVFRMRLMLKLKLKFHRHVYDSLKEKVGQSSRDEREHEQSRALGED